MNVETGHPEVWAIWEVALGTKNADILQQVLVDLEGLSLKIVDPINILAVKLYASNKIKNPNNYPN